MVGNKEVVDVPYYVVDVKDLEVYKVLDIMERVDNKVVVVYVHFYVLAKEKLENFVQVFVVIYKEEVHNEDEVSKINVLKIYIHV